MNSLDLDGMSYKLSKLQTINVTDYQALDEKSYRLQASEAWLPCNFLIFSQSVLVVLFDSHFWKNQHFSSSRFFCITITINWIFIQFKWIMIDHSPQSPHQPSHYFGIIPILLVPRTKTPHKKHTDSNRHFAAGGQHTFKFGILIFHSNSIRCIDDTVSLHLETLESL